MEDISIEKIRKALEGKPELVEQLTPLRECITTRWEVYARTGDSSKVPHCQLCDARKDTQGCDGCVIDEVTGGVGCIDTPYVAWRHAKVKVVQKQHAKREVDFLRNIETVLMEMT